MHHLHHLRVHRVHRDLCLRDGFRERARELEEWQLRFEVLEKVVFLELPHVFEGYHSYAT